VTIYAFTSIGPNYLPKATVLAQTVKRHSPTVRFVACIADIRCPDAARLVPEFDEVWTLDSIPIDGILSWAFRHTLVELCTGIKGAVLHSLLRRPDCSAVVYLDPDIVVFSPLEDLLAIGGPASILLTPHVTEPEHTLEAVLDNECAALRHGVYNLGFIAVRNDAEGHRFAQWWSTRLEWLCYDDIPAGLFTDQRWIDLVPGIFRSVAIIREPGWNVATWNLTHRRVTRVGHSYLVNDTYPLRFVHFSGLDSGAQLAMLHKYGSTMPAMFALRTWYVDSCAALERTIPTADLEWTLACFDNRAPIMKQHRLLYAHRQDLQATFPDPYATADVNASYYWWVHVNCPEVLTLAPDAATELMLCREENRTIYSSRSWRVARTLSKVWAHVRGARLR